MVMEIREWQCKFTDSICFAKSTISLEFPTHCKIRISPLFKCTAYATCKFSVTNIHPRILPMQRQLQPTNTLIHRRTGFCQRLFGKTDCKKLIHQHTCFFYKQPIMQTTMTSTIPLDSTTINATVLDGIATITYSCSFTNKQSFPINPIHYFSLDDNAIPNNLHMRIGERFLTSTSRKRPLQLPNTNKQ